MFGGIDGMQVNTGGTSLGLAAASISDPSTYASLAVTPLTITAPLAAATPAASATPTTLNAIPADRIQALSRGAAPITNQERAYVKEHTAALEGLVTLLTKVAAESSRQARLGRDIYGRPQQHSEDHAYEQRVLDLVNAERARHGVGALTYNRQLDAASEGHNAQQAATRTMAHSGIGDGDPGSRIRSTGFGGSWGENVATGQLSPEQVVREWMASPGHRRNILDPEFRQLGVAYGTATDGRTYWTQSFGG